MRACRRGLRSTSELTQCVRLSRPTSTRASPTSHASAASHRFTSPSARWCAQEDCAACVRVAIGLRDKARQRPAWVLGRGGRAVPVAGVGETGRSRSASFMIYHRTPARHTGDPSSSHIRIRVASRSATRRNTNSATRIRAGLMTSSALSRSAYCVLNCLKARVSASSCALVTSTSPWHHADNGLNNAGV